MSVKDDYICGTCKHQKSCPQAWSFDKQDLDNIDQTTCGEYDNEVDIGERHNVFPKGLVDSQVKTLIVDHPDKLEALMKAIKTDQEITDGDIPEEEQGSNYNNALPFKGKRKAVSVAKDFIAKEDMPE